MIERRISTLAAAVALAVVTAPASRGIEAQTDPPPAVLGTSPTAGAVSVSTRTTVRASFSEPVDSASIVFELRDPASVLVASAIAYDELTSTAVLTPGAELTGNTLYTATVVAARTVFGIRSG